MRFDGAREQHLVVTRAAADAMDEMIDLVDERVEERPHLGREMREHLTEGELGIHGDGLRKAPHGILAMLADFLRDAGAFLESRGEREHGIGVTTQEVELLLLEEREERAVFLQLVAQALGNKFPGSTHG